MLTSRTKRKRRAMALIEASGPRRARQNDRPCPVPLQVRTKAWIERDGVFVIGEGGLRLLLNVVAQGSLLAASREIGWSSRHAWQYLRRAEQALGFALVTPRPGKGGSARDQGDAGRTQRPAYATASESATGSVGGAERPDAEGARRPGRRPSPAARRWITGRQARHRGGTALVAPAPRSPSSTGAGTP